MINWRKRFYFHPQIKLWIDSINTIDQLNNAYEKLPLLAENDTQRAKIKNYIWFKNAKMASEAISDYVKNINNIYFN